MSSKWNSTQFNIGSWNALQVYCMYTDILSVGEVKKRKMEELVCECMCVYCQHIDLIAMECMMYGFLDTVGYISLQLLRLSFMSE